ncbi:uncharacterized protein N7479_004123 [Penicillium vulpinum]|uniref:Zn(2)-C6 fungal-type domain-containing protein n=1 Tax=Penicillium vulpinum TaxID=29845 RepID=A0A1V6SBY8_9EURO|nr:uncharacterized protein N7479_004123 [Penicillium vulpinum]KAJ5964247.1 hypothetical protein N7479_004123 [Penicillium vulpinum]OQE11511.1 hypothetical protein PENVUL_c002G04161 [Penicillium vulpinum]
MPPHTPKRACDQCHTLKEKCRRSSATTSCERCDRLSQTCKTTRNLATPGRKPRGARKLSYNLPASILSSATHNAKTLDLSSSKSNTPYPHFYLPFDEGLSSNPALFPELDLWERHFLNLMKDIVAPSPLDKFLIGPSFVESHHRLFVQNLLRPAPTPILRDAAVACAAVLLGDQYAQYTKTGVEIGHRRAALAVSGLRSLQIAKEQDMITALVLGVAMVTFAMHVADGQPFLISRYTLTLVKPVYHTLLAMDDPGIMDFLMCLVTLETFECLLRSEMPTIRIGELDRCNVVDRYLGISSSLFAHLYDLCEVCNSLKAAGGRMDIEMVERLGTIQDTLEKWQPSPPPDLSERFTPFEITGMLAQANVLRLAAMLIVHRLRYAFGQCDDEALQFSSALTAEIDMVLQSTGRSIPCTSLPYVVACFEITGTEARAAVLGKIHKVATFSRQSQLQARRSLSSIWDARDSGDRIYWFNIGDYIRKTPFA